MGEREAFSPEGWCQGGEGWHPSSSCPRAWQTAPTLPSRIQPYTTWPWPLLASMLQQVLLLPVPAHLTPRCPEARRSGSLLCTLGNTASPNSLSTLCLQHYKQAVIRSAKTPVLTRLPSQPPLPSCSPAQQHPEGTLRAPFPSLNTALCSSRSPTTSVLSSPYLVRPGTAHHPLLPKLPKLHPPSFSLTSQAAPSPGYLLLTSLIPSVRVAWGHGPLPFSCYVYQVISSLMAYGRNISMLPRQHLLPQLLP